MCQHTFTNKYYTHEANLMGTKYRFFISPLKPKWSYILLLLARYVYRYIVLLELSCLTCLSSEGNLTKGCLAMCSFLDSIMHIMIG